MMMMMMSQRSARARDGIANLTIVETVLPFLAVVEHVPHDGLVEPAQEDGIITIAARRAPGIDVLVKTDLQRRRLQGCEGVRKDTS
jgi:hypothetical protein